MMLQLRSSQATVTSFCQHLICLLLSVIWLNLVEQPIYIHSCIWNAVVSFLYPTSWAYFIVYCAALILFTFVHSLGASVEPIFWKTRWSFFRYLFGVPSLLAYFSVCSLGTLFTWSCLHLSDGKYATLTIPSTEERVSRLNEHHVFLTLSGLCVSVWWLFEYLNGGQYVKFPDINRLKWKRIEAHLVPMFLRSGYSTLKPLLLYYVAYYLKGGTFRDMLVESFGLAPVTTPIDTLWGVLDVQLFISAWIVNTCLIFSLDTTVAIFEIFYTEPIKFAIEEGESNRLSDAMKSKDGRGLLSCLAYQDLYRLSDKEPARRSKLFTLSQPGGHPRIWKEISSECLTLLKAMNDSLGSLLNPSPSVPVKPQEEQKIAATVSQVPKSARPFVVNWNHPKDDVRDADILNSAKRLQEHVKGTMEKLHEHVMKIPLVYYMFGDLPAAAENSIIRGSVRMTWAVQVLSMLVSAAFTEDKFGVAQTNLSEILSTLLSLHDAVERLDRRWTRKDFSTSGEHIEQLRNQLRHALRQGIYRIVITYDDTLRYMNLSSAEHAKLRQFAAFEVL